jgi:hypothetical protein
MPSSVPKRCSLGNNAWNFNRAPQRKGAAPESAGPQAEATGVRLSSGRTNKGPLLRGLLWPLSSSGRSLGAPELMPGALALVASLPSTPTPCWEHAAGTCHNAPVRGRVMTEALRSPGRCIQPRSTASASGLSCRSAADARQSSSAQERPCVNYLTLISLP